MPASGCPYSELFETVHREDAVSHQSRWDQVPSLLPLIHHADSRGTLDALDLVGLPFTVKRAFLVSRTGGKGVVRGEHAHRRCHQLLIAVHGHVQVDIDDGSEGWSFVLSDPSSGLHIPPGLWGRQTYLGPEPVLLVLASHLYDRMEYLETREDFIAWRASWK